MTGLVLVASNTYYGNPYFCNKIWWICYIFYVKVQKTNYKWEANKTTHFWLGQTVNPLVLKGSKRDIFCTRSQTDFVLCFCRLLSNLLITSRNCDLTISSPKIRTFLAVIWNTWVYLYIWICWISITFHCRFFRISFCGILNFTVSLLFFPICYWIIADLPI